MWQDWTILGCQAVMGGALIPTLRDRSKWPHLITVIITSASLTVMCLALSSMGLYLSGAITGLLGMACARMCFR